MEDRIEVTIGAVLAALAVLLGLGFHFRPHERVAAPVEGLLARDAFRPGVPGFGPPATRAELAILAPLRAGAMLGDWRVEGIDAVTDGVLVVHLLHGESRINLQIASSVGAEVAAPVTTGPYAIFVTHSYGPDALSASGLAEALAQVLNTNWEVPPPPGLRPFAQHDPTPSDPPDARRGPADPEPLPPGAGGPPAE